MPTSEELVAQKEKEDKVEKEKEVEAQVERHLFLEYCKEEVKFILKSSQIVLKRRFRALFEAR